MANELYDWMQGGSDQPQYALPTEAPISPELKRVYINSNVPTAEVDQVARTGSPKLAEVDYNPWGMAGVSNGSTAKDLWEGVKGTASKVGEGIKKFTDYDRQMTEDILGLPKKIWDNPQKANEVGQKFIGGENWASKIVKSGATTASDVLSGEVPQWEVDPVTGDVHTSSQMIERAQDMSALAGTGGLGGAGAEAGVALGAGPMLRPALKYKDKITAYHGTTSDFDKFKAGDIGVHFGNVKQANSRLQDISTGTRGDRIIPVEIKTKNPLLLKDVSEWEFPENIVNELYNHPDKFSKSELAKVMSSEDKNVALVKLIEDKGYDSIKYLNRWEGLDSALLDAEKLSDAAFKKARPEADYSYIVFKPNTVQSKLTGQTLFADSSKPGTAIEALAKTGKLKEVGHDPFTGETPKTHISKLSDIKHLTPLEEMTSTWVPKSEGLLPQEIINPEKLQGSHIVAALGDRTAAGHMLTHINGKKLAFPVDLQGGKDFARGEAQIKNGAVWASEPSVTSAFSNHIQDLAAKGKGKDINLVYTAMSDASDKFSHHMSDAILAQMPGAEITKSLKLKFDKEMKARDKNWPGIDSPDIREYLDANRDTRITMLKRMDTKPYQHGGFPEIGPTRAAVTDKELIHKPTGTSGGMISRLDPTGRIIEKPAVEHHTYSSQLAGKYSGKFDTDIPRELMWPDFYKQQVAAGQEPKYFDYVFGRGYPKTQIANQKWLDNIMKFREAQQQGRPYRLKYQEQR